MNAMFYLNDRVIHQIHEERVQTALAANQKRQLIAASTEKNAGAARRGEWAVWPLPGFVYRARLLWAR